MSEIILAFEKGVNERERGDERENERERRKKNV